MRPRATSAALALCALVVTSPAGAAPGAAPVRLGGTVVITASTSFEKDVVIPRDVTVTTKSWTISGDRGRLYGFAFRPPGENRATFAFRNGFCSGRGCRQSSWAPYGPVCYCRMPSPNDHPERGLLKAGRYQLYVVTDGVPITVTMSLDGLTGRTSIKSGRPVSAGIAEPDPTFYEPRTTQEGPGGNLYSSGATHTTGDQGGIYTVLAWKIVTGAPKSANPTGFCQYLYPAGSPTYQAPCDNADRHSPGVYGQTPTGGRTGPSSALETYAASQLQAFGVLPAGTWGLGGYVNSESPALEVHMQVFWLDFV